MKHLARIVPPAAEPEAPKRKRAERPASDRTLLRFFVDLFAEYRRGMPIARRRSELRTLAHMAVDKWFDAKIAGR